MSETITLDEYKKRVTLYEEAYEAGLTAQRCTVCDELVIEKEANYNLYSGSGVVVHGHCYREALMLFCAPDWWELTMRYYDPATVDRYMDMYLMSCGLPRFSNGYAY